MFNADIALIYSNIVMKEKNRKQTEYEAERDVVHDVNCVYRTVDAVAPHFHQSIEITCLLRGRVDFYIGGEKFSVSAGQIAFVPSYYAHYTQKPDGCEEEAYAVVLIVPKKYYEEFERQTEGAAYFLLDDTQKNRLISERMRELADAVGNMSELLAKAYVNMIFGLIAREYDPVRLKNPHDNLMMEIIRFIDEHYEEELTLDRLSLEFGYSKYYFSRLFNRAFRCNLNAYINSVRARAVKERTESQKKTKAIFESGFNSLSTYYRTQK